VSPGLLQDAMIKAAARNKPVLLMKFIMLCCLFSFLN
jgi:hypothetical protein